MNQQPFGGSQSFQIDPTTGSPGAERYEVQADETRTNTAALANSRYLVVPVNNGETIIWWAVLTFGYGASPGQAKVQFNTPTLSAGGLGGIVHTPGPGYVFANGGIASYNALFSTNEDNQAAGDLYPNVFWGHFTASAGGQFVVQWAQNAANATPTTLVRGSYIEVHRR